MRHPQQVQVMFIIVVVVVLAFLVGLGIARLSNRTAIGSSGGHYGVSALATH
jgi:hypothetical protein